MPERLISTMPAPQGYLVSVKESNNYDEPVNPWGPWRPVLAWGFTEWGEVVPLTFQGPPADWSEHRIKAPDGKEVY